jgi:hypothetical protein
MVLIWMDVVMILMNMVLALALTLVYIRIILDKMTLIRIIN